MDAISPQGLDFHPVAPALATARRIGATAMLVSPACGFIAAGIVLSNYWYYVAAAALLLIYGWSLWLIPRQVRAMGWAEGADEFVIRKGILLRSITLIPYGRIQYVDVSEGPIARHFKMTTITLHTASAQTSGQLDGIPTAEAARLRDLLAKRGSAELAGL